jgi:hypothetical protein
MMCATTFYKFIQQDKVSGEKLHKHLRHGEALKSVQAHQKREAKLSDVYR